MAAGRNGRRGCGVEFGHARRDRSMATWAPLRRRLANVDRLTLRWAGLEALVGPLPRSAYRYAAYWGSRRTAWAGFHTRDVRFGESVTFAFRTDHPVNPPPKFLHLIPPQTHTRTPRHYLSLRS